MFMLSVMLIIMGSSPVLIHCNSANSWELSTLKGIESKPAQKSDMHMPTEDVMDCCCCAKNEPKEIEVPYENGMKNCMEIVTISIQPSFLCDDRIELPTPAEMVSLMALIGINIDNWLHEIKQPQFHNLSEKHYIVPPRDVLCHNCILLC